MPVTPRRIGFVLIGISSMLLAAAFWFEHALGLRPCDLCITQRWAHVGIIIAGLILALRPGLATLGLAKIAAFHSLAWAVYHSGVERGVWEGPAACSGGTNITGMSAAELLDVTAPSKVVSCADPAWVFLQLSMAEWNAIASFLILDLIIMGAVFYKLKVFSAQR